MTSAIIMLIYPASEDCPQVPCNFLGFYRMYFISDAYLMTRLITAKIGSRGII